MIGLIVWSVLCFGVAMICGAAEAKFTARQFVTGLGVGSMLWAIGLGIWLLVGLFLGVGS